MTSCAAGTVAAADEHGRRICLALPVIAIERQWRPSGEQLSRVRLPGFRFLTLRERPEVLQRRIRRALARPAQH